MELPSNIEQTNVVGSHELTYQANIGIKTAVNILSKKIYTSISNWIPSKIY